MKGAYILCIAILVTILLYVLIQRPSMYAEAEGFETLQDKIQDRSNPLAAVTNPLQNPASSIGIPESIGASLQTMASSAFGTSTGSSMVTIGQEVAGPRIDNENSFLGMIQFCKTAGASDNPFNDPKFAANCGMCMTSGSLLTGETFKTPTGVIVYPDDKTKALADQKQNRYPFPRVIPSLKAATCVGASQGPNATPALAINEKEYAQFAKAAACASSSSFGNGCGVCVPTKAWGYLDTSENGNSISISLFGKGTASVYVAGKQVISGITLSDSKASTTDLGPIAEGTVLDLEVVKRSLASAPYVYAAVQSKLADGTLYTLSADTFMETDTVSRLFVRHGTSKFFSSINAFLPKLLPVVNATSMKISGPLPVTFIQEDNLAAYSCPSGPFVTQQASYTNMINDDPCTNPAGQGPGNYDDSCLRKTIVDAGCTSSGSWYSDPTSIAGNMDLATFKSWIMGAMGANGVGCTGVDSSTPCDPCRRNPTTIPTAECLKLLYTNQSAKTAIGSGYPNAKNTTDYTSLQGKVPQFCQPAGTLNPTTENGLAELVRMAANGYAGKYGMEAVKDYLSDIYTKATNTNLNIHLDDSVGGSKTSWTKCFGLKISNYEGGIPATASRNAVVLAPFGAGPWASWWFEGTTIPVKGQAAEGIYWIHNSPGAITTYPVNERVSFYKLYTNTSNSPIEATLYSFPDNSANAYINGKQISSDRVVPIVLPSGENLIQYDLVNGGGPAGHLAFCIDRNGTVLFKTDSTWKVTPPGAQRI